MCAIVQPISLNLYVYRLSGEIERERKPMCGLFSSAPMKNEFDKSSGTYLHDGRCREKLFDKGAGGEVVTQADGQMLQDGLDRVARLLACDPQILLKWTRHRRKDGLRRFVRIHRHCWPCFDRAKKRHTHANEDDSPLERTRIKSLPGSA